MLDDTHVGWLASDDYRWAAVQRPVACAVAPLPQPEDVNDIYQRALDEALSQMDMMPDTGPDTGRAGDAASGAVR